MGVPGGLPLGPAKMLTINDLSIWFRSREAERQVVSGLSLSIAAGEVLGLVGESGSGKSVTALAILRLLDPAARVEGAISFDGVDLLALSNEEMRKRRGRDIAMISGADDRAEPGHDHRRTGGRGDSRAPAGAFA